MKRFVYITVVVFSLLLGAVALNFALRSAQAAASLSITPIAWNVVGLDSNNVNVGPNDFPIGARVCNTGDAPATNVTSAFVWDSANALVNLRPGSLMNFNASPVPSLAPGACYDFYYEVEVTRNAAAYDTTRRYHITATADIIGTVSTPTPREVYVEHLISQNRNSITDVKVGPNIGSLTSVPAGGAMNLIVGNTYTIQLIGGTATQGYNQFEEFINFPNTIFQILGVSTSYSADDSPYVLNPNNKLYADACQWQNDPNAPTYRSCVGGDFKAGGNLVVTTYTIKIISGGGTSQTLGSLLYDFSGSSFHYNGDYSTGARIANVLDPASATISKSFSPNPVAINGVSVLTITLGNPTGGTVSGYNFVDNLPANLLIANPAGATTTGCGTPTLTANAGASSISFSNGTLAANSNCIVKVNVAPSATGSLVNTTNNLFIDSNDTGHNATATLTVSSAPPPGTGLCGVTLANWSVPNGTTANPPDLTGGVPTVKAANVATATLAANISGSTSIITNNGHTDTTSWSTYGYKNAGQYIQFTLDTTNYTGVQMSYWVANPSPANGPTQITVTVNNGGGFGAPVQTINSPALAFTQHTIDLTGLTNTSGNTLIRLAATGANNDSSGASLLYDDMVFTGCTTSVTQPTIAKAFAPNPIALNGVSTLTFTLTNPNSAALHGAAFSDTLPTGVQVAATPAAATTCSGGTWTPAAGATTLSFSGGTIPASGSCTVSVNVTATTSGGHSNVSGTLSTTESGTNTASIASASLTAVLPPSISKLFAPNPILAGGVSTLTFTITNPNQNDALSGVAFGDTFPTSPGAMVVAATPNASTSGCGSPTFAPAAGAGSIAFSGGTVAAGGTCTVSVNVTAPATGTYNNTSGSVSHVINAQTINGNTASASLTANPPNPAIHLLKEVGASASGPWLTYLATNNSVYYRFTVENTGDVPLLAPQLTDNTLNVATCNASWSGITLPVAVAANENHIIRCVVGPISAANGSHTNTAHVSATYNSNPVTSPNSSATYATTGLTLAKSVTESSYTLAGDVLHYSYLVTNSGFAPLAGPVSVADNKATVTCPAVSTVGDLDNFLDPGESLTCTATYVVTGTDVTNAQVTNIATALADGVNSNSASRTVPLSSSADVSLVKTLTTSGPFTAGQSISYTLVVANAGPSTATSIQVTDTPTNLTITNVSGSGCAALPCTIASLASGANTTINVTATINAAGAFDNSATATASQPDPNTTNNTDNSGNGGTASQSADVSIVKTLTTAGPYHIGQSISYTLVVANGGPSTATSIQVTDTPTNLSITNVSGSGCAALPCTIASLASGANTTITVTATINAAGAFDNSASANGAESDPNTSNNTDNTGNGGTASASADVSLVKTLTTSGPFTTGQSVSYTLVVANAGPSTATSIQVTDTPTNLTITNVSGSGCAALPCTIASLASGANTTITVTATINAAGAFDNSATATGVEFDPNTTNNTDSTGNGGSASSAADLSITKTDGVASVNAGGTTTYTLVISNAGPSAANGALLTDPAVTNLTVTNVACTTASGGAACPGSGVTVANLQGSGISMDLPVGGSLTFTVAATIAGSATGNITNTATITPPSGTTDPAGGNNSASDTNSVTPVADLSITKTDGVTSVNAGGTTTYTLVISNAGPSTATGALLTDPAVTNLSVTNVSCTGGTGGAACPGGGVTVANLQGSGISVNLPSGGTLTFTVAATIAGSATGSIINSATITPPAGTSDPSGGNNTASDTDTVNPVADLSITKTDGVTSVNAGGTTTYTLVISNAGPSVTTGALLTDPAVANLTVTNVNCSGGTGGAACPGSGVTVANLQGSGIAVNLPVGGSLTFTVTATVAGGATGSIINSATIAPPAGTSDPAAGNNTASDTDTINPVADLSITKTDGVSSVNAGGSTTYTLTLSNGGPSAVAGALLTDPAVANLTVTGVSCSGGSGGASCPGSGVTVANLQGSGISVSLPSGGSMTFTVMATVSSGATGSITNTATLTAPGGTTDPTPGNNSASDTDAVTPVADLSITKTDGVTSINAGGTTTYTLVVSNAGPSATNGALLTDPAVANLNVTNVTCTNASGGAACPGAGVTVANLQGSGISVNLPANSSLTFSVAATVSGSATGSIINTATIAVPGGTVDPTPGNNSASDTDTITPVADLSITKTDGVTSVNAGGTTTYTLVISNAGPSTATGALLTDPAVTNLSVTNVSCTGGTGGAACPGGGVTVANLQGSGISLNLPSGGSLTFTVTATVAGSATGSITNTATISAPAGTSDPTPGNNSASDTDTVTPVADLSVTKTDGVTSVNAGGTTTYTLVISNAGPSAVTDAALTDPAVTNLTVTVVNCSGGTGGATCPASGVTVANLQGSGIGVNLPAGSSLTFTVIAAVAGSATGSITNTATITLPSGTIDPTPGNNTASDTDTVTPVADLSVTKTDGVTSVNAGGTTTYTLTIQNSGPSAVTSALLTDPAVTSLTVTSVNCTGGTGGATCPASGVTVANLQGSGISVNLPSGGTLTFTVAATIAGSATDSLTNTATITPPSGTTDPTPGNNTASDTDTITPVADLSITKSDGVSSVNAGGTTTYTLVISNAGPSAVTGATLTDPAVTNLTVTSVNCTNASGGAACPGSGVAVATLQGSGISVNLPSGSSLTFTVAANVAGGATGSLTNTATITVPSGTTDPTPGNNTTSDTDTIIPVADLSITKTDGVTSVNAGGTTTYTLVISNAGPSTATGALLTDPAVAKLTVTNVACTTGTGGASCPASGVMVANLQGSGISVNLPSGSSLPITVTATVIGSATGSVTNTATITAPVGTTDPTPANNSASDTDTITPVADLSITKTDGVTSINAGGTTTYTLVVSNAGPSAVTGAALTDPAVTNLTVTSVNCGAVTGGAVCPASGVTVANLQGSGISLNLPANSSMTFTVGATVASSATGNITNTTAIAAPSGTTDPTPGNNTASDTDVIGSLADLSITKTDGVSSVLPGSAATYTLVISNAGPSAVTGATLTDPVVTNLTVTNVTCTNASGGAACPGSGVTVANLQGSGISLNLPAGASLTFTVAAAVSNKATGSLTNTATITPPIGTTDPTPSNNSASDTNVIILAPTISKAFGVASLPLGGSTSLSFTLTNPAANTVALTGVGFTDTLPTGLVVATPNGVTGSCGGGTITATAGTGSISLAGATLGVNSSCTFGVNVNGTTAGIKNNTTGNVTSTNGGQGNTATATTTVVAPSTIAKAFASSNILLNGTTGLSFTLTNPNATVALTGVAFNDPLPAGLVVANPANLNGACGGAVTANAGAGAISLAGGTIAANSSCTISVNVTGTTVGTKNNTTSNITSTNGGQGNTASATLNVGNLSASITDPVKCLGPGGIVGVSASVTNGAAVAQSVSLTASLPAQLLALPGTCTATAGTCTVVNASTMTFSATLAAGQTATINYQAQVADGTPSGAQLCVNSAVSFSGGPPTNVQACTMVNCQPVGPGLTPPVLASDQTAGSVLVYNFYSSSATSATAQNTRINLTNIHQVLSANVHMFFLDGAGCSVADKYICLTPNQTASFLASDIDPGTTGYLVAVAVDRTGCPINFNYLIGDEYVKLTTGHAANLGAEAFSALAGSVTPCDANATAAVLNFDGVSYARAPRVLALDNIADRTSGNDTLLVLNRFGGNLAIGASTLSTLTGVLYDDAEKGFSFGFNGSGCQFLSSLSNNFPRTAPRFEQIIPAGRSGWLKLWLANEGALLGAAINANRNAAAAASAFNQGHNLHKLTLTTAAQLTIPVFPPSC